MLPEKFDSETGARVFLVVLRFSLRAARALVSTHSAIPQLTNGIFIQDRNRVADVRAVARVLQQNAAGAFVVFPPHRI